MSVKRVSVESAPARATKSCSPHISPHVSGGDTTMLPHELWRLRWLGPLHDEQARLCARSMFFDRFTLKMVSGTCRVLSLGMHVHVTLKPGCALISECRAYVDRRRWAGC